MGLTRAERIALHKKQERLQVQKNAPSVAELSEGVPTLRSTPEGLVEYVRYNNQLYKKVYIPESTAGTGRIPAFHVELVGSDDPITSGDNKVTFNTIVFDTKSGFNNTASGTNTYSYTIGKGGAGLYYMAASLTIDDLSALEDYINLHIVHNDSGTDKHYRQRLYNGDEGLNFGTSTCSVLIDAKENDYVYIEVNVDENADVEEDFGTAFPQTWFEGFKIN